MPRPGYEPFLRAICENPDDALPRLVYADWLDERGDPERAEFIRAQSACAANPHHKNPARRRVGELAKAFGRMWRAELPQLPLVDWGAFERGFVSAASFRDCDSLSDHFDTVFAASPVQTVHLVHCRPWMIRDLVRSPYLGRVHSLFARGGYVDDETLGELTDNPAASRLEEVVFNASFGAAAADGRGPIPQITDQAAFAFARSPHLPRLKRLTFWSAHITPAGAESLRARFGPDVFVNGAEPMPPPAAPPP